MTIVLPELPDNLKSLDEEEERIQRESLTLLQGDRETSDELQLIHDALDTVHSVVHEEQQTDKNLLAIQMLGARLFNSVAVSLKLMLRGYYQASFAIQRDLVETGFLLSYFGYKPEMVEKWRICTAAERKRLFAQATIRQALDHRDGFEGQKRREFYQVFCESAAHPTYPGMRLLAPEKRVKLGPFLDNRYLRNCVWELTRLTIHAVLQLVDLLRGGELATLQTKRGFMNRAAHWLHLQKEKRRR